MTEKQIKFEDLVATVRSLAESDDALDELTEAVIVAGQLSELSDELVDHFVNSARQAGASWNDIGEAMGVTRQAAQKRFVGRPPRGGGLGAFFTRFGDGARSTVRGAVAIAHNTGADHVGSEHLVAALVADDNGVVAEAVREIGGDLDVIRASAGGGAVPSKPVRGHLPFAREAKKVLELSLRETIRSGSRSIGEEHIALAIMRNTGSPGEKAFQAGGITYSAMQQQLEG